MSRSTVGKGRRRSARGKGGGATGRRRRDDADFNDDEFKFLSTDGASRSTTRSTGSKNRGGKSSSVDQGRNKEIKGGRDKENVGPSRRTTRSSSKAVASVATTEAKPAAGRKKTDTSGKAAQAGDVILVSRGDGKEETAEVLEKDPRSGVASLWFEEREKAEIGVHLSGIKHAMKERYAEPVPQNQDLPSFDDVAPGAPEFEPDDHLALLMRMSKSRSLHGVSYDKNLLN